MFGKLKIVTKRYVGNQPVHDISVLDNHHYILENGVISHNSGFVYASSIVVAMQKRKLKEDDDGNKVSEVRGIRAACKIMKTRYNKPFENVEIKIPWDTGMDPYSGLITLFEKKGVLVKDSTKMKYTDNSGTEHKHYRKSIPIELLDLIMDEWDERKVAEPMEMPQLAEEEKD